MAESSERALTPDEAMDVTAARDRAPRSATKMFAPPHRRTAAVDLARSSPEDP